MGFFATLMLFIFEVTCSNAYGILVESLVLSRTNLNSTCPDVRDALPLASSVNLFVQGVRLTWASALNLAD